MKYVFGPVPSRRLGQSLGIDTIPLKTCNWNCVYCQLGRTRPLTSVRKEYFSSDAVAAEVRAALETHQPGKIDWVTFVGSGEPLLHSGIGRLIRQVKEMTQLPVAVITNGSLLYLSGVLATPDISWLTIAHFAQTYRVIAPFFPAVKTMDKLVDGIAATLRHESVEQAHVLGGSYGGFVAQAFVRRYPELTRSLVLSHTFPPDPANGEAIQKIIRWLPKLPQRLLRWLLGKRLASLMPPKDDTTGLLRAMFAEILYHRLTKADLLSSLWRTIDYCAQEFTPQDLSAWPGKVLLVMADDDPGTPEPVRTAMLALYPRARLHLFHGTGHSTAVLKEDEYQTVIGSFLKEA